MDGLKLIQISYSEAEILKENEIEEKIHSDNNDNSETRKSTITTQLEVNGTNKSNGENLENFEPKNSKNVTNENFSISKNDSNNFEESTKMNDNNNHYFGIEKSSDFSVFGNDSSKIDFLSSSEPKRKKRRVSDPIISPSFNGKKIISINKKSKFTSSDSFLEDNGTSLNDTVLLNSQNNDVFAHSYNNASYEQKQVSTDNLEIEQTKMQGSKNVLSENYLEFKFSWITKIGSRAENQDSYLLPPNRLKDDTLPLWGVFDGHGPGGGIASYEACKSIQSISAQLVKKGMNQTQIEEALRSLFKSVANELLKIAEKEHIDRQDYGTTAVLALYDYGNPPKLIVANVGDSRAILVRSNPKFQSHIETIALSVDHKLSREDERSRISSCGGEIVQTKFGTQRVIPNRQDFTEDIMRKRKLALNMTRALGHIVLKNYGISCEPEFQSCNVQEGDKLVLASDGLWEIMENHEVGEIINNYPDLNKACKELVRQVESRCKLLNLASDNLTIVIVAFQKKEMN